MSGTGGKGVTGLYAGQVKYDADMDRLPTFIDPLEIARKDAIEKLTRNGGIGLHPEEKRQLNERVRNIDSRRGANDLNKKAIDLAFRLEAHSGRNK